MASLRPPSLDTCYAQWYVQPRDISPHSSRSFLSCWLFKKAGRLLLSFPGPFSSHFLGSPPGFPLTLSPGDAHIHGRPRGPCQSAPKADVAKQIIFKRCHDIITKLQDKGNQKRRVGRRSLHASWTSARWGYPGSLCVHVTLRRGS